MLQYTARGGCHGYYHTDASCTEWSNAMVNLLQQSACRLPLVVQNIQVGQRDAIQDLDK